MENEILKKIEEQGKRIDEVHESVEKIRKYFLWALIISVGAFVIPLIGLIIIIPWFLKVIGSAYSSLGL